MSRTLNLVDILLTTGRHQFLAGHFGKALDTLSRLAEFRKMPRPALEEMQSLLAEIHLRQGNYKAARRHLTAAIAASPLKAEYHVRMAAAIENDESADYARAEMYHARAVQLEPHEPDYWANYGDYLFTISKVKDGLRAVRRAYALGVANAEVVARVGAVLRDEGHAEEATTKLRAALFHNHGAPAFRQLWQRHQFELLRLEQEKKQSPTRANDRPVLLPFSPSATPGKYVDLGAKTFRIDQAEPIAQPQNKTPQPARRPPQKG